MTLAQGDTIGSYEIISQVGQGGMATVYKAYHPQLDRYVAVKIIHQSFLEDENFVARFRREAQIVARLDHPNIVPVYDFNSHEGQPFLVMKFIEGVTLKTVLSQNLAPFDQLVTMMQSVASALSYAHSRGVLHRDMKPSNILVDHEQRPYITDFGLARLVQAGASTLSQDMLLGTPHYISPEQARGEQELGPAADIYSLGVILYEITVGRVPFTGNTPYSIVHDHIFTPLPLPTELNPDMPPALEQVLLRALAKSPEDRYRSAVEMLEAFQNAAVETGFKTGQLKPHVAAVRSAPNINSPSAKPVITIPATAPTDSAAKRVVVVKSSRSSRKNWLWAMLIVLGLIAITLLAIVGSIMSNTFQEVSSMVETRLPTLAVLLEYRATAFSDSTTAALLLYDVPLQPLDAAQQALADAPNDPVAHLALARAQWQAGDPSAAQQTINSGQSAANDRLRYLFTAAVLADETASVNAAAVLYVQALALSQTDQQRYAAVRAAAGEYLYDLARDPSGFNLAEIQRLDDGAESPIVSIMLARLLLTQNRPLVAQTRLRTLPSAARALPEAALVRGEILAALNQSQEADAEWSRIATMDDVPEWIRQRAASLLQST